MDSDSFGSNYDLKEALSKLEPDITSSTRSEAVSRSRVGSEKKKFSLGLSLSRFSRSPSPTSSSPSRGRKRGKSPLTVDAISRPMDLRPMGATGPTTSPDFLSPSSPSSAASPTSAASGATSPNSDRSTSPNQLGTSPKTDTSASATNLRLRKPLPEAAVANIDAKPAEVEKKTEPKEYRCVKEHKANEDTELSLEVGDIVELLEKPASDKEFWWYGINRAWGPNNGSKGFFPAECVVLETFEEPTVPVTVPVLVQVPEGLTPVGATGQETSQEEWIEEEVASDLPATVKPGIKLVCIYPFERSKADELEIEVGDVVVVLEAPEGGWWRGMKGFSTKTPKSGWFPSTLVTLAPGESIPGWSPTTKIRTKKVNPVVEVPVLNESPSVPVPSEPKSEPPAAPEPANESTTVDVTPPEQPDDTASNDTPLESTKNELSRSIFLDSEVASAHRVKSDPSIVGNTSPAPTRRKFSLDSSANKLAIDIETKDSVVSNFETEQNVDDVFERVSVIPSIGGSEPVQHSLTGHDISEGSLPPDEVPPDNASDREFMTPDEAVSRDEVNDPKSNETTPDDEKKLVVPKKGRHARSVSMPPISAKAAANLTPLKDEPEEEEEEDRSRLTPSSPFTTPATMGRMSDVSPSLERPESRWSMFKQSHVRSLSQTDSDRVSKSGNKWALPLVEGSRSSLAIRITDSDSPAGQWSDGLTPEQMEAMDEKEKKRMKIIFELVETEKDYVRDLKIIIENFMRPMADSKFSKNVDVLFSNVDELLSINSDFLKAFETKMKQQPSSFHGVGEIFLELGEKFTKYSLYCANHSVALSKLQNLVQTNRGFRMFLEDICKNPVTRQLDLGGFLIKPVQRICKYPLLLKEIIKNTNEDHREYPILALALETVQAIIAQVNDGAKAAEGVRKMVEVQNSFTEKLNIITPTRYLVREDNFNLIRGDSKKARKLFFFNDLLIVARKDWQSKFRLLDQFNLRHCRICDIVEDNDQPGPMFEIEVVPAGGSSAVSKVRRFLFSTDSVKIKNGWIDSYRGVTSTSVKKKKFSDTVIDGEDEENVSGGFIEDDQIDEEKDKPIPIAKKLEMYKEEAKKALIEEYKLRISELEKHVQLTEQFNEEAKQKLADKEAKYLELEAAKLELDATLWTTQCALSEAQALIETIKTQMTETVQKKEEDIERVNVVLQASVTEAEVLKVEIHNTKKESEAKLVEAKAEVSRMKQTMAEAIETEKAKLKNEVEQKQQLVESIAAELAQTKTELESKLVEHNEKAEIALAETKKAAEERLADVTNTFESKLISLQEVSAANIARLEATLQSERLTYKTEIDMLSDKYKNLELQSSAEKQKLSGDLETIKRKAYQAHEVMKKALTDTKAELSNAMKSLKEQERILHDREEALRDKTNVIGRLELEKQSLSAELVRSNLSAENSRQEYAKLMANMEKVVQERHQVLARKESEISELAQRVAQHSERTKNAEHNAEQARLLLSDKQMHFDETVSHLREEMSKMRAERARETEQLENLTSVHKEANKQLESAKSQLNHATDVNRRLANDNNKMKELISNQTKTMATTAHDLQETKLLLAETQDRLKRKEHDLTEISQSEASLKEKLKALEDEYHQLVINFERSDTRNFEMAKAIESKDHEITELKESVRKITEFAQSQLHQELSDLKQKMTTEAGLRYDLLAKENAELQIRLNREMAELKGRKDHEEQIMAGQLELVERLEKETTSSKFRCEKEIEGLKTNNQRLEDELKVKAKTITSLKKKVSQLESEKEAHEQSIQSLTQSLRVIEEKHQKLTNLNGSQADEIVFLKSRLANTEKEATALSNRMDLYTELDRKYLQLREHSDHISFEVKSKESLIRQAEQQCEKKEKEINALELIIDEIANVAYNVNIANIHHNRGLSPVHNIRISGLKDDSKAKSVLCRINDISIDYDRVCDELTGAIKRASLLEKEKEELLEERELTLVNVKKMESKFKDKTRMYKTDVETLEEELAASKKEFEDLKLAKTEVDTKLNKTIVELTEVENKLSKVEKDFADLLEAHKKLKLVHAKYVDDTQKEVAGLKESGAKLLDTHNETILKLKEFEGENSYLKNLTDSLMSAKMKLQASLDFVNSTAATFGSELERLKQELNSKLAQLELATEANKQAQIKIQSMEASLKDEVNRHEQIVNEYARKFDAAENEMWRKESDFHHKFQKAMDKKRIEIEDRDHKIKALSESLEDSQQRAERLSEEIQELDEKLANMKSENSVLCAEIVDVSRRENAMRCKLDIIQSKIMASNQNIEEIRISEQTLSNALGVTQQQQTPQWKPKTVEISKIQTSPVKPPPSPIRPSVSEQETANSNKNLVKATLKMIDGILGKKTLILRKLVSCEKSILSLLDAQVTEKLDFDGILEMSSIVKDRANAPISKDTALRTLEYLANVSTSINHSREGKLVIIHRARRDVTVAKDLLHEMHEFVRIWLCGFEDMPLILSPTGQITQVQPTPRTRASFNSAFHGHDTSEYMNESTWVEEAPHVESTPNPLTAKTPAILLALPKIGNLFDESEMNTLLGSIGETNPVVESGSRKTK